MVSYVLRKEESISMDAKEIGKRLESLRGSRSQAEVARATNLTPSAIWMYEHGERIPKDEIKIILAKYYKTSVAKIFYA